MIAILEVGHHEVGGNRSGRISRSFVAAIFLVGLSIVLGTYYWRPLKGLSIDDSYIFAQYAENLAEHGELSFNNGDRSLGVTSLAWTILLAASHRTFGGSPITEAQVLGALLLGASGSFWAGAFRRLGGSWSLSILIGITLVTDPFLVSHSISGMESALNLAVLSALVWHICGRLGSVDMVTGILMGLAFLTRPDNLVLLPALLTASLVDLGRSERRSLRGRGWEWAALLLGFAIVSFPLCFWSYQRSGSVIPPTRIGKLLVFLPVNYGLTFGQFTSLGVRGHIAIAVKCFTERILPMFTTECERAVLPAVLMGICSLAFLTVRRCDHRFLCIVLAGYSSALVVSYALLFPVVKDRHLSNVHSIAIAGVGMLALYMSERGSARARAQSGSQGRASIAWRPFVAQGILCLSIVGSLVFVNHYRDRYVRRVANINVWCLTGTWLSSHTPVGSRLALEPIGAIKYCSQMYVLDMGGLATRDTWESISQGQGEGLDSIDRLLRARRVDYIIDHHPSEWLGRLADKFPESYHLVERVEAPSRERAFGATDAFDVFATQWGRGMGERR